MNITTDDARTRPTFTEQQLKDWRAYEAVRASAAYNMFDPRAQRAAGLSGTAYSFVMSNYGALREAAGATP